MVARSPPFFVQCLRRAALIGPARTMQVLQASNAENMATDAQPPAKVARTTAPEVLRVKKLSDTAVLPKRGSALAAGYDLSW